MGYTTTGGPKGLGVVTDSNTPLSDFNKMIELIARVGNLRVGTTAARDLLSGDALYEGLHYLNTTTDVLEFYTGSGWAAVGGRLPILHHNAPSSSAAPLNVFVELRTNWGTTLPAPTRLIGYSGNSAGSGGVFTPQLPGIYEVQFDYFQPVGGWIARILLNGSTVAGSIAGSASQGISTTRALLAMNGTTDNLTMQVFSNTATAVDSGTALRIDYRGPLN